MKKLKKKAKRATAKEVPHDGFHWEEWREGRLLMMGYHNGSDLSGRDASVNAKRVCQSIPLSALVGLYKK